MSTIIYNNDGYEYTVDLDHPEEIINCDPYKEFAVELKALVDRYSEKYPIISACGHLPWNIDVEIYWDTTEIKGGP